MKIILDLGSGLTCKNETTQVVDMVSTIDAIDDRRHEIILKWQLFTKFGELTPLYHGVFSYAVHIAREFGYSTTASVFDYGSIEFLRRFDVPFVKIAAIEDLLSVVQESVGIGWWPDGVVASAVSNRHYKQISNYTQNILCCVREYPARPEVYETAFTEEQLRGGISDHTDHTQGFSLAAQYRPALYETHFCLPWQTGPDTGTFALRPEQLKTLLRSL